MALFKARSAAVYGIDAHAVIRIIVGETMSDLAAHNADPFWPERPTIVPSCLFAFAEVSWS